MSDVYCPVCKDVMRMENNPKVIICPKRSVYVPEFKKEVSTIHATYYKDTNGKYSLKIIETLPYIFVLLYCIACSSFVVDDEF